MKPSLGDVDGPKIIKNKSVAVFYVYKFITRKSITNKTNKCENKKMHHNP